MSHWMLQLKSFFTFWKQVLNKSWTKLNQNFNEIDTDATAAGAAASAAAAAAAAPWTTVERVVKPEAAAEATAEPAAPAAVASVPISLKFWFSVV